MKDRMRYAGAIVALAALLCGVAVAQTADTVYRLPDHAVALIDAGRYDEARDELARLRRDEPDNPYLLYYQARIEEDYRRARWMYQEVERMAGPELAAEARFRRAELAFAMDGFGEARELYAGLLETYPGSPRDAEAWNRLGVISLVDGNPSQALVQFSTAREMANDPSVRLLAAAGIMECRVAAREWQQAVEAAIAVLAEPDDASTMTPRVLEVLATAWGALGNDENARLYTDRLLTTYPYSWQAYRIKLESTRIAEDAAMGSVDGGTPAPAATVSGGVASTVPATAKFTVQAGAFQDQTRGLTLLRKLQDAGLDARLDMKTVQNTHFFVIQVGYFALRDEAERMCDRVSGISGESAIVVILN